MLVSRAIIVLIPHGIGDIEIPQPAFPGEIAAQESVPVFHA